LEHAYSQIEKADQDKRDEATIAGNGYMPLILSEKRGVRLGTRRELDLMLKHVRKGCCEDPVGVNEINIPLDPTDECSDLIRLRGTSQGESVNRLINKLTSEIGRQTAETADKRLWLRITRYNLEKDRILQKVLGLKKVRSMEWYLHQAVLAKHPNLSIYKGMEFPAEVPDNYDEPIGIQYGRYKNWRDVDVHIMQVDRIPLLETQPATPPASPATIAMGARITANINLAIAAAATTPPVFEAAPSVALTAVPNQQPDTWAYGPQQKWSRNLKPMPAYQVSVTNTYLFENTKFTPFQEDHFWKAVQQARTYNGGDNASSEKLDDTIQRIWNEKHIQLIRDDTVGIGLGGMIRIGHVKSILQKKGNEVIAARSGSNNPYPKQRRTLKREQIDTLTFSSARTWLVAMGRSIHSRLPKRKEEIMKHFDGKPAEYEFSP
jgi:hypothetical protein